MTSPTYEGHRSIVDRFTGHGAPSDPAVVLQDGLGPGDCWAFAGSYGHYGLALDRVVNITHISIDHPSEVQAADITRAPRSLVFWGLAEGGGNVAMVNSAKHLFSFPPKTPDFQQLLPQSLEPVEWAPLLHFHYAIHTTNHLQLFEIPSAIQKLGISFGIVALEVLDNWGSQASTCIYCVGVYGEA